jgi:hypothetical protein
MSGQSHVPVAVFLRKLPFHTYCAGRQMYLISTHIVALLICPVAQLTFLYTTHNTTDLTLTQHPTVRKFAVTRK